ncbi:MAG: response regulator [Candidatus Kapaibacterium sp.]
MKTKKIRALIIEDSDDDLQLMLRELEKGQYEIEYKLVEDAKGLDSALEKEWDIIISDYSLPGFTGYDALLICKEKRIDIPFIMVSGTVGEDIAVEMMKCGAKDYIMKNKMARLLPAIEREIEDAIMRKKKVKAETDIKNSQNLLQRIIDLLPIRTFWKDNNLKYLGCNSIFAKDAGKDSSDEIIGKDDFEMVWKNQAGIYRDDDMNVLLTGKSKLNYEEPQTNPTGDTIWLKTNKVPLTDLNGNTIGILGSYEDITDQKKMITELITAKEKAEEMNKLKSSFLANMSHELRTPMVGILGFSELICELDNLSEIKEMSAIIRKGALRLFNTLNQILDLSILESNKAITEHKPVNIIEIIKESINLFQTESSKKNLQLRFQPEVETIIAHTDQKVIYNCLLNLIQNAISYTAKGSIEVKVKEEIINGDDFIAINVIDTGIGISKENIKIIFDEFRQASEGWGRSYEGTGLGLSICRKSINLINGMINVSSEPGVGSDFRLIFPKNSIGVNNEIEIDKTESLKTKSDVSAEKIQEIRHKILFIEDDNDSFEFVSLVMRQKFDVEKATTAEESILKARQNEYVLILLDINLGIGMNGLEAMHEIRKIPYYKNIPIIALTSFAMKGDKEEFIAAGCTDYISKPFDKSLLIEKISKALTNLKD